MTRVFPITLLTRTCMLLLIAVCADLAIAQERSPTSVAPIAGTAQSSNANRLRLIVETDAGGDPDDEQSLVRFLLYANEWDVEGIIANRPTARERENLNVERTGLGVVQRLVKAYGECYSNLVKNDDRYPQPELLLQRTVAGYGDRDDGVNLILAAVDADDPRPVWFLNWGTDHGSSPSCLKRALDKVLQERGPQGYAAFKSKLRLSSDDQFGEHTTKVEPPFKLWVDTFRPPVEGKRWYHRFSALTATAGGFDLRRDVLENHGPLGALYPTNTTHTQKEGDTMTFLYLVPTGMNDPEQPTWGSWAGRYGRNPDAGDRSYYWANQADAWQGTTQRDNTLRRWAADLQNDFRARLDWCIKSRQEANHPPIVVVNGHGGTHILHLNAEAGATVTLDSSGSSGPDGQQLAYQWFVYPEAGTYRGNVNLTDADAVKAKLTMPGDAAGRTIHAVLAVRDQGTPPLARYRRVVVNCGPASSAQDFTPRTHVTIANGRWRINGKVTYPGAKAEGLLMNVRMVNAVFEDANDQTRPKGFDADANTEAFIKQIPAYVAHSVRAFTLSLQGGDPRYEGAVNSAFNPDGSLREAYLRRVRKVIEACDKHGVVVILGCFYQRQDQVLKDEAAVRAGVANAAKWIKDRRFTNVVLEIANEYAHRGFDHRLLQSAAGEVELIALAKKTAPDLLVSTSGMGSGTLPDEVAQASDFLLIHFNTTKLEDILARIAALKKHGKPIVVNEDDKLGADGATSARLCVDGGASWGFMHKEVNQHLLPRFNGALDDPVVYAALRQLTSGADYFPPADAQGGWRTLESADEIRRIAGIDRQRLDEAFEFVKGSTKHGGLLVLRHGWLVYENYFGLGHRDAAPNLASVGKSFTSIAVGTLLHEHPELFPDGLDQKVFTERYLPPEAFPLTDPRKQNIRLGQLLAMSAGIRGNNPSYVRGEERVIDPPGPDGSSAMIDAIAFGQTESKSQGRLYSAKMLWCDPGEGYSYATSSIHLASVVLRHTSGIELQQYVDQHLAQPMGWGTWGYGYKTAPEATKHTPGGGGIAVRATDMLRFGYLLLNEGRWQDKQLVPAEYVHHCARQSVYNPHYPYSLQFNINTDGDVKELPRDAYWKSGSGGHVLYVVPSLDLVVWKLGGRDEQYSPANTGLPASLSSAEQVAARNGWKETVTAEMALRKTLSMIVDATID